MTHEERMKKLREEQEKALEKWRWIVTACIIILTILGVVRTIIPLLK